MGVLEGGAFAGALGGGTLGAGDTLGKVFSCTAFGGTVLGCRVLPGVLRFLAGVLGVFAGVLGGLPTDFGGRPNFFGGGLKSFSTSFSSVSSISDPRRCPGRDLFLFPRRAPPSSGLFCISVRGFTTAWNKVS